LRLNQNFNRPSQNALVAGLMLCCNALLLQFCASPSPDLAVYVLTFFCAFYFAENFKRPQRPDFALLLCFVMFACFIKVTAFALCILPAFLILRRRRLFDLRQAALAAAVLLLFV